MYLYFKDDGKLFLRTKVSEPEAEVAYTKKLVVPDDFVFTKTVTDSEFGELQQEMNYDEIIQALTYSEKRAVAYPSIPEQLDNIFHNGIDAWKADIQAIKDQFPKN